MAKFTLPECLAGKTLVLLDKYPFKDGVFTTTNAAADKMKNILCRDYECTLEYSKEELLAADDAANAEGSLSVQSTKLGLAAPVIDEDAALKAEAEAALKSANEAEALKAAAKADLEKSPAKAK